MKFPTGRTGRRGSRTGALALWLHRLRLHYRTVGGEIFSQRIDHDGIRHHLYRSDRGKPTLILLHGFLDSALTFRRLFPPLLEKYNIIACDLPGFGRTRLPPVRELWDVRIMARIMGRLFYENMGLRRVEILAHSLGGLIAMHLAGYARRAFNQPLISRMHLIAPGVLRFTASERDRRRRLLFPQNEEEVRFLLQNLYAREGPELSSRIIGGLLYQWTTPGYFYLAENTIAEYRDVFFSPATVPRLNIPLHFYWGERDRLTPLSQGETLRKTLPRSRLHVFPGAGHALHLERPEELLEAMLAGSRLT